MECTLLHALVVFAWLEACLMSVRNSTALLASASRISCNASLAWPFLNLSSFCRRPRILKCRHSVLPRLEGSGILTLSVCCRLSSPIASLSAALSSRSQSSNRLASQSIPKYPEASVMNAKTSDVRRSAHRANASLWILVDRESSLF